MSTEHSERAAELCAELRMRELTVDDVAFVLGLDRSTVLRYLRDEVIIGYQLGREWFVNEASLRAYFSHLTTGIRRAQRSRSGSQLICCYRDCEERALWEVCPDRPYEETHACNEHLAEMCDAGVNSVVWIGDLPPVEVES